MAVDNVKPSIFVKYSQTELTAAERRRDRKIIKAQGDQEKIAKANDKYERTTSQIVGREDRNGKLKIATLAACGLGIISIFANKSSLYVAALLAMIGTGVANIVDGRKHAAKQTAGKTTEPANETQAAAPQPAEAAKEPAKEETQPPAMPQTTEPAQQEIASITKQAVKPLGTTQG